MLIYLQKAKQYLWAFVEIGFLTVLSVILIYLILGPDSSGVFCVRRRRQCFEIHHRRPGAKPGRVGHRAGAGDADRQPHAIAVDAAALV
jgi:hypothetical protein